MPDFFIETQKASVNLPLNGRAKVFMFGVPSYSNMGDQAVSLAERKYFENEFPDYQYIEIMDYDNAAAIKAVQKIITSQDIVAYTGGGNMGSLYTNIEQDRRKVFASFINNLTISFPQSIFFEKTEKGENEKTLSRIAYEKNPNLVLIARDAQSYRKMQKTFKNQVIFTPDMVLYLQAQKFDLKRHDTLFVFRNDGEKVAQEPLIDSIKHMLSDSDSIHQTDTVLASTKQVTPVTREKLFIDELKMFAKQKLIISDRFHAMIFSVLTGTPCPLFGNRYGKGKHAYFDWLENIDWVNYTDEEDLDRIQAEIVKISEAQVHQYNLRPVFKPLHDLIAAR